jgi:SagB-type dehydrogenase family enzyme
MHSKTARRYGERGTIRYVSMDVGHLGQNVHLIAESMGLGTVMVGAFIDKKVQDILDIKDQLPMYIMPVGVPAKK